MAARITVDTIFMVVNVLKYAKESASLKLGEKLSKSFALFSVTETQKSKRVKKQDVASFYNLQPSILMIPPHIERLRRICFGKSKASLF
jgi:hypothetical protein